MWCRNTVQHQLDLPQTLIGLLYASDNLYAGPNLYASSGRGVWKPADEISPDDSHNRRVHYVDCVEGRKVADPLDKAARFLADLDIPERHEGTHGELEP